MKPLGLFRGSEAGGLRPGNKAWIVLGLYVLGWDAFCRDGETLSEAADDWPPLWTTVVAFAVAGHVSNRIPPRWDAVHWAYLGIRALREIGR